VQLLKLALNGFKTNASVSITLDSTKPVVYNKIAESDTIYLAKNAMEWTVTSKPGNNQKGPHRYGTFKEAFNNRMVFVYSTRGSKEENEASYNKAKFDAESWYYRGNGSVDIIADKDYTRDKYVGRNVIIYGNAAINSTWQTLLKDCPIQVHRNVIKAGDKTWSGDDLATYFVYPQNDGITSVGVVAGTGVKGMNAAFANQYFAGGSGFADFMVFRLGMLQSGAADIKMVGFFDNEWKLNNEEMVENE
jgi:hypothetical protein